MKKIKSITLLLTAVLIAGTGCLKDKGFEDNEYGANDPDGSPAGVGFTLGARTFNNTGLVVSTVPQNIDTSTVLISLLSGKAASTDVHVKVQVDDNLVTNWNTDQGTNMIPLDPSLYSIVSNDISIPAGKFNAFLQITVPTTIALDPNVTYGLGLKIVSADAGYVVASNEDELVLSIAIKNAYDGEYTSDGYLYHPTAARSIDHLGKELSTINATTVKCPLGDLGPQSYIADFDVDPTTFHVTVTVNSDGAGGPYYQWDTGLPTAAPGPAYTPQWPGSSECNNTYDPGTQTFKMRYGYIGGTGYRIAEEIIVRD